MMLQLCRIDITVSNPVACATLSLCNTEHLVFGLREFLGLFELSSCSIYRFHRLDIIILCHHVVASYSC